MSWMKGFFLSFALGAGLSAVFALLMLAGGTSGTILILADAFTVSSVLLLALSILYFVSRRGVFDIFSYVIYRLSVFFSRGNTEKTLRYADYKARKRGGNVVFASALFPGIVFFVLGAILSFFAL